MNKLDLSGTASAIAIATGGAGADDLSKRAPDSAAMLEYWDLTDTLVEGAAAVRAAGEIYLPKFIDETKADYEFRQKCTKFTNIYRDIVEGLATKPFEEECSVVEGENKAIPEAIKEFIEDVDGAGNNLTVFASLTFFNGINSAIDWIFVDYPTVDTSVIRTVADVKSGGIRPFWSHVLGRNVLEARVKVIAGKEVLTYIRILEPGQPDHIRIFERADNGAVSWSLHEKKTDTVGNTSWINVGGGVVTIGVIPLVPFATGRRDGRTFKYWPAMRDAADLQVELYQQESDLKFAKKMTAYPMLAGNGIKPQMQADGKTPKSISIGPGRVLYSSPAADGSIGSWAFIEPNAASLVFLANDVKATIEQLRELGRQPLTATSGNLTVITTAVAAGKARSAVGAWSLLLKDALENAMRLTCLWLAIKDYEPEVNVYNEFDDFTDGGADLTELGKARDRKDISRETYWSELKRRKVLSPEFDHEQEEERLLEELPGDGMEDDMIDPITGLPLKPNSIIPIDPLTGLPTKTKPQPGSSGAGDE